MSLTSIAANIIGANREIRNFELLDTMNIEALIENTMLHDAVSLFGSHRAGLYHISALLTSPGYDRTYPQTMPGSLDVSLYPFFNMGNILLAIFQVIIQMLGIAVQQVCLRSLARFDRHAPAAVLNTGSKIPG
jgi:hypothetical protein